jgi:hypothetical protein
MFSSCAKNSGTRAAAALLAGIGLAGCESTPPPDADMRAAEIAVGEANEAQAAEYAAGPFVLAQNKLDRARDAFEQEDFDTARRLAQQAEVDAQFAEASARSEIANARVAELRESIRILREEIERQGPGNS